MLSKIESSQIIFFLGAGASKYADVPTTYEFVEKFLEFLKNESDKYQEDAENKDLLVKEFKLTKQIIEKLSKWKSARKEKVDIELLLETLTKLNNRNVEPLLQIFPDLEVNLINKLLFEIPDTPQSHFDLLIDNIITNLKTFIKLKTIVKSQKIDYLQPFRGFIQEAKDNGTPLDIISLNYDTCIEQFCNVFKMQYEDGFDINWNPETFNRRDADIRLYKLHGSAIWYQSDRGTFLKLPVKNDIGEIQLISDEKAETLMLYPMQKWDYAEPLLELLLYSKSITESHKRIIDAQLQGREIVNPAGYFDYKFLIIIGYSFRDEHIKRMVRDVARRNTHLYLIIVDPEAKTIYDEIKYYDSKLEIQSHLWHRVVCLPYKFEEIFPYLRNQFVDPLRRGLVMMDSNQRSEYLGQSDINWKSCIYPLARAEFCEVVDDLIKSKDISFDNDQEGGRLPFYLSMSVNLSLNGEKEKSAEYVSLFKNSLRKYYNNEILIYSNNKNYINIDFKRYPDIIELRNSFGTNFFVIIKQLLDFCNIRLKMSTRSDDTIGHITEVLTLCDSYSEIFERNINGYEEYIKIRQEYIRNLAKIVNGSILSKKDENIAKIDEYVHKIEESDKDYSNSLRYSNSNTSPKHELRDILINYTEKIEGLILINLLNYLVTEIL